MIAYQSLFQIGGNLSGIVLYSLHFFHKQLCNLVVICGYYVRQLEYPSFPFSFTVPPVATITPSTLRINETETAEFVCSTTDGTSPFIFQWFSSAGDITSGTSSNSNMSVLTIPNAMLGTHDGAYSCNVTLNQSDVSLVRSDSAMAVLNISSKCNLLN